MVMDFSKNLDNSESFGEIFSLVKKAAEEALEKRRDGLIIALQYLPESLGAYYGLGSNFIVMNKALLEKFRLGHVQQPPNHTSSPSSCMSTCTLLVTWRSRL
jgi:hypothetical protein